MVYTVSLSPAVDYVVHLDSLPLGAITRTKSEACYFSGKGINVSKVLSRLGTDTLALGFVAGFTGRAMENALTAEGIRHGFCTLEEGFTRINLKLRHDRDPETDEETETDLNGRGPDIPPEKLSELVAKLSKLTDKDTLVLTGSCPPTLPKTVYRDLIKATEQSGRRAVVDAEGELLLHTLPLRPFLTKPNDEELGKALGLPTETDAECLRALDLFQNMGAQNVLLSRGAKGALLMTASGEIYRTDAAKGRCVNTIGAGDSMLAGFLHALETGMEIKEALGFAAAAGAAAAFSEEIATKEETLRIYRELPPVIRIR